MGKWYGNVGFAHTTENNPGEWDSEIIEKSYFGDIMGKDGKMKYIFKAKYNLEDDESEAFKVWTGSTEIFFILDKIVPSVVARVG